MYTDALIVFGAASIGCGVTWAASKAWARWEHRRNADVEFQRSLAWGGTLTPTGEKTGVHACLTEDNPNTVEAIQRRIDASHATGEFPIVDRMRASSSE